MRAGKIGVRRHVISALRQYAEVVFRDRIPGQGQRCPVKPGGGDVGRLEPVKRAVVDPGGDPVPGQKRHCHQAAENDKGRQAQLS